MKTIAIEQEFSGDHITRAAGERLRKRILELSASEDKVVVDFSNVVIASTSFLDEGLAKLANEGRSREWVEDRLQLKRIDPRDLALLQSLSADRWGKKRSPRWNQT